MLWVLLILLLPILNFEFFVFFLLLIYLFFKRKSVEPKLDLELRCPLQLKCSLCRTFSRHLVI